MTTRNVDIDELDFDDLIDEIIRLLKSKRALIKIAKSDIIRLKEAITVADANSTNNSAEDNWKDDLWPELKEKYSYGQLQDLLK